MPTFDTPEPVHVSLDLAAGDITIIASDRADTVVEIAPSDPASEADVRAAAQTRVDYAGGQLVIKGPRGWRHYSFRGPGESVDVRVELPGGSQLQGEAGLAALACTGPLGEVSFRTGAGDISLAEAGPVQLRTGAGDVFVDRATGRVEVTSGTGSIRLGAVDGTATVRNSNGTTWIGAVDGDLRVNGANGSIELGRVRAAVTARTAQGGIRVREAASGTVVAETAFGPVDVGIRAGATAWLDLHTKLGHVRSELEAADQPGSGDETVEVRARTSFGDITVTRCDSTAKEQA